MNIAEGLPSPGTPLALVKYNAPDTGTQTTAVFQGADATPAGTELAPAIAQAKRGLADPYSVAGITQGTDGVLYISQVTAPNNAEYGAGEKGPFTLEPRGTAAIQKTYDSQFRALVTQSSVLVAPPAGV